LILANGSQPLTSDWNVGYFNITAYVIECTADPGNAPIVVSSNTVVTNLNADTVDGKHATDLILADGSQELISDWNAGSNYHIEAKYFVANNLIGAPFIVSSSTVVTNLNADQLDGQDAPTGDIVGTTDTQILTNKTITGAKEKITYDIITDGTFAMDVDTKQYVITRGTYTGPTTVSLPPITDVTGEKFTIVDEVGIATTHNIIIQPNAGDVGTLISGQANITFINNYSSITVYASDQATPQWVIVGSYGL